MSSKTPTLDAFAKLDAEAEDVDLKLGRLLQSLGWEYTSNTPGSRWMYVKKIPDGRTIIVNAQTAAEFEMELCGEDYGYD